MSQVDLLYRLQRTEDEIREDKKRLAEVIRLQSESAALIKARAKAEVTESELGKLRAKQNGLTLDLEDLSSKAKRSEDRLYSGQVTNPKELEDLQHGIEALTRRIGVLEDELLGVMIDLEDAESNHDDAVESLGRIEEDWSKTSAHSKEEQKQLLTRIAELGEQKEQIVELILPVTMHAYEDAQRRAGEVAVVALQNNRCRGCLVTVSANQRKAADEGKLVCCDSCGRILCPL